MMILFPKYRCRNCSTEFILKNARIRHDLAERLIKMSWGVYFADTQLKVTQNGPTFDALLVSTTETGLCESVRKTIAHTCNPIESGLSELVGFAKE